jgi:Bax protein
MKTPAEGPKPRRRARAAARTAAQSAANPRIAHLFALLTLVGIFAAGIGLHLWRQETTISAWVESWHGSAAWDAQPKPGVDAILDVFETIDYDIDDIRNGADVPRVFLEVLPHDIGVEELSHLRKDAFVSILLPLVLKTNETILAERAKLLALEDKKRLGQPFDGAERLWLEALAERYGVPESVAQEWDLAALKRRVDKVPPSLALAQAAQESGWGTSRFAHQGKALFGQHTSSRSDVIVPARARDASYPIKRFIDLEKSVAAYMHVLNSGAAYSAFRTQRAHLRELNKPLDGYALARWVTRYSERGDAYVRNLRSIIRSNDFGDFDRAKLAERNPAVWPTDLKSL